MKGFTVILDENTKNRIIEMAWEDRTPFEAIEYQFNYSEKDVIQLMRSELKLASFKRWRKRTHSKISLKHSKIRNPLISRFKCSLQRTITNNRISKR